MKRLRHRGFPFSSEFCESRENIISLNICQRLLMKLDPDKVKLNLKDGPFRGCSRMGEGTRSPHHGPPALPKILSRTYYNNETWHSCILDKKTSKKYINYAPHSYSSPDISIVSPEKGLPLLFKTKIQG